MSDNKTNNIKISSSKLILGIILLILGLCLLLSSNHSKDDTQGVILTSDGISSIDNSKFEILESNSSISESGIYTINGKVKQQEDKNFSGLSITFTLYDINNNKVRSTSMNTSNYLGNGVWEFSAMGDDPDKVVTSYKLETIYGY